MIQKLIHWAVHSRLVVLLLALGLMAFGVYSFLHINVEAYPDPAPAVVEVVAQFPGASAEEVERQVTLPLEVALAGMPGLNYTRSQSMFALSHLRNQFAYGVDQLVARQEVINRLQFVQVPTGVVPQISPESPTGEIMRYVLRNPRDTAGKPVYTLNDLKSLQDWTLERLFRRVPRIADIASQGGSVKRYEIHPDPLRMQRYGITLQQLENAITSSNANVGGEYVIQGETVQVVRGMGLIGDGEDPIEQALGMKDPIAARDYLRAEEARRIGEIRQIVLNATNNVPIRVGDVVEGGPLKPGDDPAARGVVVGCQTRLGRVMISRPRQDARGEDAHDKAGNRLWDDDDDVVQGVVLLRKGEESLPALHDIEALVKELNETPGRLLPGVRIDTCYDRKDLIHVTTNTVQENLLAGMGLVTLVLLMFLSNVRSALIVALNVPLALLVAFSLLFLRGKSANLLSIGAVDFGIIADSSVIIVENIYRHLSAGLHDDLRIGERVIRAADEVQRSLLYSTAIMVCAFLPLFTMSGPEGQIFGPMADTYAFALGGAMLLAVTLSPVLCTLLLRRLRPKPENLLIRWLRERYLKQLQRCLHYRWTTLAVFGGVVAATVAVIPLLGREFMPELEEGNLWVRATFPLNISLDQTAKRAQLAMRIMKQYPELDLVHCQIGRPDDGTDPTGFYDAEFFLPLKPHEQWPVPPGRSRSRSKDELVEEMDHALTECLLGVDWNFSQNIRDNVMEVLSGVKGENSVKVIGPDLRELEKTAQRVAQALRTVDGMEDVGVFRILGQSNLTLRADRQLCARWNVAVADVQDVISTAVGGKGFSQMIEGERSFDITVRWPKALRSDIDKILKIPVEVGKHNVAATTTPGVPGTWLSGPSSGVSPLGSSTSMPALTGNVFNAPLNNLGATPRYRLRDFVRPVNSVGQPDAKGSYVQSGASDIYREQGNRLIAVKFDVRGRDLASAVAAAKKQTAAVVRPPYRLVWGGEFQEMEQAEGRMMLIVPLAVGMVVVLIYLAFRSLVDVLLVLSNVVALCCGGIWALLLTHTNFSISAAVGFISIFGVAITNGLLLVSSFHRLRLAGKPLEEAILEGASHRLRPMMMTALTATFGLLPAAVSTRIGAQSQQPLAIVVIGGMLMALLLNRYLTPVLYSLFRQEMPDPEAARLAE
jgi:cobalt-zinc-cadmium resistance protein CzcA